MPITDCGESDPAEACKRACDAGFIPSCLRFGRLRLLPIPGPYNPAEAGAAFEKACKANQVEACDWLGRMNQGDELERDYPRAASLFRAACDAGLASGCGHLAVLRFKSEPGIEATTEAELVAARSLAERACEGGHPNSCSVLGSSYFLGEHVKKDIPKARQLAEKGCAMGDFHGCELAGLAWALNWGAPPNEERAIQYQTRAFEIVDKECRRTGDACAKVADYYAKGYGVEQDLLKAFELLDVACRVNKSPEACNDLGYEYLRDAGSPPDPTLESKAFEAFNAGCSGNISVSCYELSRFYTFGQGRVIDLAKSFALIERSCALGYASACDIMGTRYHTGEGIERSHEKALAMRRKACGWRSAQACRNLGLWLVLHDGEELPAGEGRREATTHWTRACDIEGSKACFWLGLLHDHGWGVSKDRAKARRLIQLACKDKVEDACAWLRDPRLVPSWVKERETKDAKRSP